MNSHRAFIIAAALIAAGASASAQNLIDHNKAMAGGSIPGDAPGYPITISQPGSYKLMSNLVVSAGQVAISIAANGVTVDLNGFSIIGPGKCSYSVAAGTVSCAAINATGETGIEVANSDSSDVNVTVRNGLIQGFFVGVQMSGGFVESLVVRHNASSGVHCRGIVALAGGCLISKVKADHNGVGIRLGSGRVSDSVVEANATGIAGADLATVPSAESNHVVHNGTGLNLVAMRGNYVAKNVLANAQSSVNY